MENDPAWATWLKRCRDAAPKWPRWMNWLGLVPFLLILALVLGLADLTAVFVTVWLFVAVIHLNLRKAAPQYPEFGIFLGWFFLAVGAVAGVFLFVRS